MEFVLVVIPENDSMLTVKFFEGLLDFAHGGSVVLADGVEVLVTFGGQSVLLQTAIGLLGDREFDKAILFGGV